jgi:hypothetical protein
MLLAGTGDHFTFERSTAGKRPNKQVERVQPHPGIGMHLAIHSAGNETAGAPYCGRSPPKLTDCWAAIFTEAGSIRTAVRDCVEESRPRNMRDERSELGAVHKAPVDGNLGGPGGEVTTFDKVAHVGADVEGHALVEFPAAAEGQFRVTVGVTTIGIVDVPVVGQRGGGPAEVTCNREVNLPGCPFWKPRLPMFQ